MITDEYPIANSGIPHAMLVRAYNDLRAEAIRLEEGLDEIASQHLSDEMDDHPSEHADWEGGYEAIVKIARQITKP